MATGLSASAGGDASFASGVESATSAEGAAAFGKSTSASGRYSIAMGLSTHATGEASFAGGSHTTASGVSSLVMGQESTAAGPNSIAVGGAVSAGGYGAAAFGAASAAAGATSLAAGNDAAATNTGAIALGRAVYASGVGSVVIGSKADANGHAGAFLYGDNSSANGIKALQPNQFVVRAQKFWLGSNNAVSATAGRLIETSTGAYLSTGGVWTNTSDSTKKHRWAAVDAEQVLAKLATVPVRTWSYKAEENGTRHMGPTAQAFRAAFGLGDTERAIATVDADGVLMAAAQALDARTRRLEHENAALRRDNAHLAERLSRLEGTIATRAAQGQR